MMKLTQKTLFQCFERSPAKSTVLPEDSDIIECPPSSSSEEEAEAEEEEEEEEAAEEIKSTNVSDYLLPIHVRQEDHSIVREILPLIHQWKLIESNENISSTDHLKSFYRICPITETEQNDVSQLQFAKIPSKERQLELFQRYIHDDLSSYAQSIVDWPAVFYYLQEYRQKAIEQQDQLLWTEIYRPRHRLTYLGHHTKAFQRLSRWFASWSKKLHNEKPKVTRRQGRKRRRDHDDDDDDDDEDFIDQSNAFFHQRSQSKEEFPQIIFIHGCGTTSLVHALAEEHNFKVTEINGSQSRARPFLLKQLEQVTSHHYLSIKRLPSDSSVPAKKKAKNERGTIMSFFGEKQENSKRPQRSKQKKAPVPPTESSSTVQVEKASLILFDEIETLTSDDQFWSCLKKLLETAKKPILLTSNSRSRPDEVLMHLDKIGPHEFIQVESNELELIYCYLRLILLVEMFEIGSLDQIQTLVHSCATDLRRSLLTLQFLLQSSLPATSITESPKKSSRSNFPSSQVFDAISYSYLRELWTSSLLQGHFDDLTQKYRSEYERSEIRATNPSKRIEMENTLKMFLQETAIDQGSAIHLDYRPYIRQICENEQKRAMESNSSRRLRHSLTFRGCSLQWSDFAILSTGLDCT